MFGIDHNPLICIVSHIVALACDDGAVTEELKHLGPSEILSAGVIDSVNNQKIPWQASWLNEPLFRSPPGIRRQGGSKARSPLIYDTYNGWLQRLGAETGFPQVLKSYCLRRAFGNAVNGELRKHAN